MRVLTVLGTRPEIIRLSRVIPGLDACCEHTLVHTGQNENHRLSALFFDELLLRAPCHHLGVSADSFGAQAAQIIARIEPVLTSCRPDRVLILGDTNSALAAIVAKRMGIPVFHMEAGNRCRDDRVPEEVNRRIVDHCSDVLLPYTERSRENLLREGFPSHRIFVTGNPIAEVLSHYRERIDGSSILDEVGVSPGQYVLVTLHRAENVDPAARLTRLFESLSELTRRHGLPAIISAHPRLRARMEASPQPLPEQLRFHAPFGFFDFVKLEQNAYCVLSDSGTVQEECTILKVPSVTLRDVTERPETLECGGNVLAGAETESVLRAVRLATASGRGWTPPAEYMRGDVSETVVKLVTGYHHALPGRDG